ncbi:DUF883 family protein [Opitutus terrae]|nr:DUF883 domain-containing protein [Opitutus terrae]
MTAKSLARTGRIPARCVDDSEPPAQRLVRGDSGFDENRTAEETFMNTHSSTLDSRQAREQVMEDLRALVADADLLVRATAGDVSEKAGQARERLAATLERAKASYIDLQEQSFRAARQALSKTDETIRTHPYESLGVGFGLGLLVGFLLRRK